MENVTIWLAFGAGVLSFISPCCLPLYPSYLSYITGVSVAQLKESSRPKEVQKLTLLHTLFFIIGFSIIFYALGFVSSWVGELFRDYRDMIRMLSGILIAVMGLFLLGIFQPQFLMRERKFEVSKKGLGYLSSTLIGIGFAAGWTPCVGPILLSVLSLSTSNPERAIVYITAYTLGFAIPFFVMAFFVGRTRWILKYSSQAMKIGGGLMVFFGILLYTDQMTTITAWLTKITGFQGF
jgi:cytochrome c-type biogenesis protein